ncbi:methyltransferase domain-containing protein [Mumia zhuanghuii]|uniref:Class I SAM-dependent methyltransferase n=2 Tax=Mumia TaxID=1546255 RepID=A0ABW1QIH1_9ACTN|nr:MULTISPECIES: class I SAM-dependent methyltransferase [Mumia]KAA1424635.1 methyltransferase domain-containing protein [Mumia zhuanghuii]
MTDPDLPREADGDHAARLRASFTAQAATFEEPTLNAAFTAGLGWLVEAAAPRAIDRCLDLAAGTGLVGRALAPHVAHVTCVDATPAMLAQGRAAAESESLTNVAFVLGDATAPVVPPGTIDLVVTRFSLHHVPDPEGLLRAMVAACRPGGRIVVHDLASSPDPELAACQDAIETWRDDSHLRAPVVGEVADLLRRLGAQVDRTDQRTYTRPLEPWLAQSVTAPDRAEQVRAAFADELAGGRPTGFRAEQREDGVWFTQTWELTVAHRP